MSNKARAEYIKRPLNDAEREFAALPENHDLIFAFMRCKRLDPEEFYDELIIDYLVAVKQYVTEKPDLQINYTFKQVLYQRLNGQMMHYWRKEHSKIRTLEREAFRLDYQYENPEQERNNRMEPWWIDPMQNVERQVILKELFKDFYMQCITGDVAESWKGGINGYLKVELDLLLEGYSPFQVNKRTEKQYPYGYILEDLQRDIEEFRRIFKRVFNI